MSIPSCPSLVTTLNWFPRDYIHRLGFKVRSRRVRGSGWEKTTKFEHFKSSVGGSSVLRVRTCIFHNHGSQSSVSPLSGRTGFMGLETLRR